MPIFYLLLYIIMCMVIGVAGKSLPLGFNGFFLLSFFLSPIVGILLLILLSAISSKQPQIK